MGKVWQNVILEKYVSQEFEFKATLSGLYDEGSLGLNFYNVMINLAISNNFLLRCDLRLRTCIFQTRYTMF
jgi:hypothetical protein